MALDSVGEEQPYVWGREGVGQEAVVT